MREAIRMSSENIQNFSYDVALSFAGEDRLIVERLAKILMDNKVSVFYDDWEKPNLWGKDLYQHLADVYIKAARFCIVFISQNYEKKAWTNHELRSAQSRAFQQNSEYILPVRLDDTEIKGIPDTIGYVDLRSKSMEELADFVLEKLQISQDSIVISKIPEFDGHPIISNSPQQAFRISPKEIIESIKHQFEKKELAFRELGQNSVDSGAMQISVEYHFSLGRMTCDFKDNGNGMTESIIRQNYLRLFDSSKEECKDMIGYFSLGRLSAFCYDLERIEIYTMALNHCGFKILINSDMSGKLYKIEREFMRPIIQSEHGTLVRLIINVPSEEIFLSEVKNINDTIKKELSWIRPKLTITEVTHKDNKIHFDKIIINH